MSPVEGLMISILFPPAGSIHASPIRRPVGMGKGAGMPVVGGAYRLVM
ncbi:hypothetical protein [Sphingomonas lycopersici]|nr:hypothetical protein [Sphingomonas lycopersici]